jgi:hypothetical protein
MILSGYQNNRDRSREDVFSRRHMLLLFPGMWHVRQPKPEAMTSLDGEEDQRTVTHTYLNQYFRNDDM